MIRVKGHMSSECYYSMTSVDTFYTDPNFI